MRNAIAIAIAGGAVSVALIDHLTKSGFLTNDIAREILGDAQRRLAPFLSDNAPDAVEGARIIGELYSGIPQSGAIPRA